MRKADLSATGRGRGSGDVAPIAHTAPLEGEVGGGQSGSDLEGGDVLGSDNEIESVHSEGDQMVDVAADLEIEEIGLLLASAVDGVRPNGVKTQKKNARTDGDLPLGADAEVLESVVPCGSGGEGRIAIVAPPLSPAHDEGVVTLGPHGRGVSIEHQRRILAIRGGSQHRTEYCGGHVTNHPKKDGTPGGRFEATCGQTWKHGIRCRLTRSSVGVRSQNEARGRPLGLLAAWLACAVFSEDADEHSSAVPFLCCGERADLLLNQTARTSPCWNGLCARVRVWNHRHRHEWRVAAGRCAWGACM